MADEKAANFDKVVLGSFDQSECSPTFEEFSDKVKGIRVNVPSKVHVDFTKEGINTTSRIPLCIAMQFQSLYFSKFDYVYSHISVVMVNEQTGKSYSANLASGRPGRPGPRNKLPDEELARRTQRKFINVNLAQYLPLPAEKATYFVYATLEQEKSNTMTLEIE